MSIRCKLFGHRGSNYVCGKGKLIAEVSMCGRCDYVVTHFSEDMGPNKGQAHIKTEYEKPDFEWDRLQMTIWMR